VAGLRRNQWPEWIGITGRFASEYAAKFQREALIASLRQCLAEPIAA
jgi:hypothetical protein